jgi:hypothetical protein
MICGLVSCLMKGFLIKMVFTKKITNFKERNPLVFQYVEAIIEKIQFGTLRVDFEIHNKRITSISLYGRQPIKPTKSKS